MDNTLIRLAAAALLIFCNHATAQSSFSEIENIVFGTPPPPQTAIERQEQAAYLNDALPHYQISQSRFIQAGVNLLFNDAKRTLSTADDYLPRLDKLVHANGICLSGKWTITETTSYTGYFKRGANGLLMARASATLSETERGQFRGLGLAGKIYPTQNPALTTPTANFFVVDVLTGAQRDRFLDIEMTNKPDIQLRWSILSVGFAAITTFARADKSPGFRPLYPIAELGLLPGETARAPQFMKLQANATTLRNDQIDFREELNIEKNNSGNLLFDIMVSDVSAERSGSHWNKIGFIEFTRSKVSYGCDRQLHFSHPKLK